ncbi:MAG: Gx transporter family protein [Candidatus Riflebacteria bacterium]|nr:Gx transporter family protein [Candidatus Riflebacteria bacterium]
MSEFSGRSDDFRFIDADSISVSAYTGSPLAFWTLLAMLGAAASAIQVIESPLPRLLPWIKPGLSNALILYGMIRISIPFGMGVVFIRTLLSGMALGILFSPVHLLSLAGGVASTIVMAIALRFARSATLGLSGISVAGAIANNLAQLSTVGLLFAGHFPLWLNLSLMIWVAVPAGLIVARITDELLRRT